MKCLSVMQLALTVLVFIASTNCNDHKNMGELTAIVETLKIRLEIVETRITQNERLSQQRPVQGPPGRDGIAGRDGRDGRDGECSQRCNSIVDVPKYGCPNDMNNDGITKRSSVEQAVISENEPLAAASVSEPSPAKVYHSFVRWGRTDCPSFAETLYSGKTTIQFMGSPVHYECANPNKSADGDDQDEDDESSKSKFFRFKPKPNPVRFNLGKNDPFPKSNTDKLLVPCAKCKINANSIHVFKGEAKCPDNWSLVYKGLLMANNWNHIYATEVCVDENSKGLYEEVAPSRKAVLSPLLVTCNGETCGTNGDEFQHCVVCSSAA